MKAVIQRQNGSKYVAEVAGGNPETYATIPWTEGNRTYRLRKPGPGKFEGEMLVTSFIWDMSLNGGADEEAGDVETMGWYGLMKGKLVEAAKFGAKEQGMKLTPDEVKFLRSRAGVILSEDSNGFVGADYYQTEKALEEAWKEIQKEEEEYSEEEEGEGEGDYDVEYHKGHGWVVVDAITKSSLSQAFETKEEAQEHLKDMAAQENPVQSLAPVTRENLLPYLESLVKVQDNPMREEEGSNRPVTAEDLVLWIENDGNLYRSETVPLIHSLMLKRKEGIYNFEKSVKSFEYLAEAGAKSYVKQVVESGLPWFEVIPPAVRKQTARMLAEIFKRKADGGEYDWILEKKTEEEDNPDHIPKVVSLKEPMSEAEAEEATKAMEKVSGKKYEVLGTAAGSELFVVRSSIVSQLRGWMLRTGHFPYWRDVVKEGVNPQKRRISKEEFEKGYVYSKWPGQVGYAYRADLIDISSGKQIMEHLLRHVKFIDEDRKDTIPVLHMENGHRLFATDSNDFPQPIDEIPEGYSVASLRDAGQIILGKMINEGWSYGRARRKEGENPYHPKAFTSSEIFPHLLPWVAALKKGDKKLADRVRAKIAKRFGNGILPFALTKKELDHPGLLAKEAACSSEMIRSGKAKAVSNIYSICRAAIAKRSPR